MLASTLSLDARNLQLALISQSIYHSSSPLQILTNSSSRKTSDVRVKVHVADNMLALYKLLDHLNINYFKIRYLISSFNVVHFDLHTVVRHDKVEFWSWLDGRLDALLHQLFVALDLFRTYDASI